jgi:3-hydroxyisobutyrate dehydrogenase-like beta-hydroxyacid dehydrogenase
MASEPIQRIAIVGFGEAGGIIGKDLASRDLNISTFDILLHSKEARETVLAKARESKVQAAESLSDCVREAELVISAVTASSALDVAKESSRLLRAGQFFLDINSVSPGTKRKMAGHFEKIQACFVEAAVMAAVPPQRLKVPMLLGGPHAAELAARLPSIGMNATVASDRIGVASAVKMCRSVVIKGLEALAVESMFAARRYGAEDAVLTSLAATFPEMGWKEQLPDYLISRVAEHGKRRAAEMREAAQALRDVGIDPIMAEATAERQDSLVKEIAAQLPESRAGKSFSWRELADALDHAASHLKRSDPS